jgi:hypothetical protein
MSADLDHLDLTRSLAVERRQPVPTRTREQRQLDDLHEVIHLLAMALTEGKAVA